MSDKNTPRPSPIRKLVTVAMLASDEIEREMIIAEFEMNYRIDSRENWQFEMGLVQIRQREDADEIERLESLLIGLGVDPHAHV